MNSILDHLKSGETARLIPSVADSKREERATSVLLSIMSIVPDFAKALLSQAGIKVTKRSRVSCYAEVVFRDVSKNLRPDGLIVITTGSQEWSALVESKIGTANLKQDQLDDYVTLCREVGADALITISNQYALRPDHHPLFIPRRHLKYVDVAHFSWLSIISHAFLAIREHWVTDTEQTFVLRELIRYLEHESSGVSRNVKMGSSWTSVVSEIHLNSKVRKTAEVQDAIAGWHQLLRFVSIQLTMDTGRLTSLVLSRNRQRDPDLNFKTDVEDLVNNNALVAEFEIPGAAARIQLTADFLKRTVEVSSRLESPKDRARPKSSIDWLIKQLNQAQELDPIIRVYWPRSPIPTVMKLSDITEHGTADLIPEVRKRQLPNYFEIAWVIDLGSRFKGTNTFVDDVTGAIPRFYTVIVEELKTWSPRPAKKNREIEDTPEKATSDAPFLALPAPKEETPPEPPREVIRIAPLRERRYLDDRFN